MFAYDAALEVLGGGDAVLARRLRAHEVAHAAVLAKTLADRGWARPAPPASVDEVEVPEVRAAIEALSDADSAISLLLGLERVSQRVHRAAIARLRDPRHIQLAATILAAEAQHEVAWRTVR